MPNQVDDAPMRAMSGYELSRVRTEFRLCLPVRINKSPRESRRPTLSCIQVRYPPLRAHWVLKSSEVKLSARLSLIPSRLSPFVEERFAMPSPFP
jgi:hypothetical protein